jgi:NTP pyrophosphatase (non-canonical NTP hydrolase)
MADVIAELTKKLVDFRDRRAWGQFHTPRNLCVSISLETAELLELGQWKSDAEFDNWARANRQAVADECADVLSYLLLLANEVGIDLARAVEEKIQANEHRYPVDKARGNAKKYSEL